MIGKDQATSLVGATAYSSDRHKVGHIGHIFFDDKSGEPAWATVSTGLFGRRQSFVPLDGAQLDGDIVRLDVDQHTIRHAPNVDPHTEHLLEDDERALYSYYNRDYGSEAYASGTTADEGYSGPGSPRFEPATPSQHAAFLRAGATMAGGNAPPRTSDEGAEGAYSSAKHARDAQRAAAATSGEKRRRVRLRRYHPSTSARPVEEQAQVKDETASGQNVGDTPTTEAPPQ